MAKMVSLLPFPPKNKKHVPMNVVFSPIPAALRPWRSWAGLEERERKRERSLNYFLQDFFKFL
jgi:hypothetical protein